jgi:hypothetical protein
LVALDLARERTRAEQVEHPAHQPAHGPDVLQDPVEDRVRPRHEAQLHAIAVLDDQPQQMAHGLEAIDHGHLGGCRVGVELFGKRTSGRCVPLADVGGQDQDAARGSWRPEL